MNSLGNKIRTARMKQHITQSQLSQMLKIGATAISNWENDLSKPDLVTLEQLCRILNVSPLYFFNAADWNTVFLKSEEDLIKKYRHLDSHGKELTELVIEKETLRMNQLEKQAQNAKNEQADNVLQLFCPSLPVSAGSGVYLESDDGQMLTVAFNRQTARADFCLRVNGRSMEPDYQDGDYILIHSQPDVEIGEDGIFIIDGAGYVKQRGPDCLISKNMEYDDIYPSEGSRFECKGKVIGILNQCDIL